MRARQCSRPDMDARAISRRRITLAIRAESGRGCRGAAGALALRLRFGEQHRDVAIRLGSDFLRLLGALGTILRGLLLTFGLHALVDRLAVLLRQVGASNTHVDYGDAVALRLGIELVAHTRHEMLALVTHH